MDLISEIEHLLNPTKLDAELEPKSLIIAVAHMGLEAVLTTTAGYIDCSIFARRVTTVFLYMLDKHPDLREDNHSTDPQTRKALYERQAKALRTRGPTRPWWESGVLQSLDNWNQDMPSARTNIGLIFMQLWQKLENEAHTMTLLEPTGETVRRRTNPTGGLARSLLTTG